VSALALYAGPTALARIREEGIKSEMFRVLAGASGGPKWFVLYGLDRYLFGDFFANRQHSIATVGSSAGAWRMACMGMTDPVAAIDRLATFYSRQQYSDKPTIDEISAEASLLLNIVLGLTGEQEIVDNPLLDMHIIVARARGLLAGDSKWGLSAGLGMCALSNTLSRSLLPLSFQRYVFYSGKLLDSAARWPDMKTHAVALNIDNVKPALLASGSIPLVMKGITDIPSADKGVYRDGGLTDYHLDLPFAEGPDLVLYPHFYSSITPGWFDKFVPWRRGRQEHLDNVLLIAPSREFVETLPFQKIPDRKDFETLDFATRQTYWQTVLKQSERLAEDFALMVESGRGIDSIRPIDEIV
jgi:hypothetical protein